MTATPIPRTIALTFYGNLDLSYLDELPPGRQKIKTWVVPKQKREPAYDWIRKKINEGDQAFIICPLIEESESETLSSVKAAKSEFIRLQKKVFPKFKLGLLHGRMKGKEKEAVLTKFRQNKLDILVATPVVEVGIDIPNATIMLIEEANRFGLAQLHQLRGRVGRGEKQSYCLLFASKLPPKALKRLKALEKDLDGAQLAEIDLKMRGPGEIYGTKQHGFPQLKIASFSDTGLIKKTRQAVLEIFPQLKELPLLQERLEKDKIEAVEPN
jgi:ATP-dependent DNA helicase RecG